MIEAKRGVFWLIDEELLCFPFDKNAEYGVAKSGNTYNHKLLWEHVRPKGCNKPYDYYPRGRVEIDVVILVHVLLGSNYPRGRVEIDAHGCPVVFMSPQIDAEHIPEIMEAFSLLDEPRVVIDGSRHYRSHLD